MAAEFLILAIVAWQGVATAQIAEPPQVRPIWFHVYRGPVGESFFLASDAVIRLGSNTNARLIDLRVGEIAHVTYTIENGVWLAHEIVVNPPHGSHAADHSTGTQTNELHAHGKILAYNAATGHLTIKYHR